MLHKKQKGTLAELAVGQYLIELGWNVLFPVGENTRYDLIAERDGVFKRVQVKYATPKNGCMDVNCRSSNNWSVLRYTKNDIDVIAAYNPSSRKIYFIDIDKINNNLFKIRLEPTKNKQKTGIHLENELENIMK